MSANTILLETEVQTWGEKCAEYSEKHGKENPDLLVEYGKALFKMAKSTSSLVNPEKSQQPLPMENPNVQIPDSDYEEEEEEEEDAIPEIGGDNSKDSKADDNDEGEEEAKEDEDEDDFTFAFEILDSARVLYAKEEQTDEIKRKLIGVRQLLGDVSLEDDNPQQAVEDYLAAVELKKEVFGAESGEVSVSEYTLSIAYDALEKPEESYEHLKKAVEAAKSAKLPSADELETKLKDLDAELKAAKKLKGKDSQMAKNATMEGIVGRKAVETAVKSIVDGANDISQLTRKRKKPAEKPDAKAKKSE